MEFVEDREAAFYNLLWLVIASPILVLHWKLFKHAKWSSELREGEEEGHIVRQFCCPGSNPAGRVIDSLLSLLQTPTQALRVVAFFHGPLASWPGERKLTVQQLVLVAAGQLFRKLVSPWTCYPWRLWPLAFDAGAARKHEAAEAALSAPACCLDECFTRKLKALALARGGAAFLLADSTQAFVRACFTRMVPTSTFVERRCAAYGAWNARRAGAPRLATLAAKHVTSCLRDAVAHWREQSRQPDEAASARSRPEWVADRAKRQTGLHLFSSEQARVLGNRPNNIGALPGFLQQCRQLWADLSAEERSVYSRRAREQNAFAAAQRQAREEVQVRGGPWSMAQLKDHWPMCLDVLQSAVQGRPYAEVASEWRRAHAASEQDVSNTVLPGEKDVQLFGSCPLGGCQANLSRAQNATLRTLQADFATLVRLGYAGEVGKGALVLRARSVCGRHVLTVAVCFATRTSPPESVVLELQAAPGAGVREVLYIPAKIHSRPDGDSCLANDADFCVRLARLSAEWQLSRLHLADPGESLDRVLVREEEHISHEELQRRRLEALAEEAVLRAAKRATAKARAKATAKAKGQPKAKAKGSAAGAPKKKKDRSRAGKTKQGHAAADSDSDGDRLSVASMQ